MKIIINRCYGGYGVSASAIQFCRDAGAEWAQWPNTVLRGEYEDENQTYKSNSPYISESQWEDKSRICPFLIQLVEQDSKSASGPYANLKVVDTPFEEEGEYEISDYDGMEKVVEPRDEWF